MEKSDEIRKNHSKKEHFDEKYAHVIHGASKNRKAWAILA